MLGPNQAVPTQSPHNHCVGSAASKRSSTAELILAFIYTPMWSVTSPKGGKGRIFLMSLCWNGGGKPQRLLLCNWECKIYRVIPNELLKGWNRTYSIFVLLIIKSSVNLPLCYFYILSPKAPAAPKSQANVCHPLIYFISYPALSKANGEERIPTHSHTLTARRETFNNVWGAPSQVQYVETKSWFYRDDCQKVLLTFLEAAFSTWRVLTW